MNAESTLSTVHSINYTQSTQPSPWNSFQQSFVYEHMWAAFKCFAINFHLFLVACRSRHFIWINSTTTAMSQIPNFAIEWWPTTHLTLRNCRLLRKHAHLASSRMRTPECERNLYLLKCRKVWIRFHVVFILQCGRARILPCLNIYCSKQYVCVSRIRKCYTRTCSGKLHIE